MPFGGGSHCRRKAPHESGMSAYALMDPGVLLISLPNLEQVREEASVIPESVPSIGVLPMLILANLCLYVDLWPSACAWQV